MNTVYQKDFTGHRFDRWTVVRKSDEIPKAPSYQKYLCRCSCGKERLIRIDSLIGSQTRSCGCLMIERVKKAHTTHGLTDHYIFNVWVHLIHRCYDPNDIR